MPRVTPKMTLNITGSVVPIYVILVPQSPKFQSKFQSAFALQLDIFVLTCRFETIASNDVKVTIGTTRSNVHPDILLEPRVPNSNPFHSTASRVLIYFEKIPQMIPG